MIKKKTITISILTLILIFLLPTSTLAQQSFSISPSIIKLTLTPNQKITKTIKLINNSPTSQTLTPKIQKLGVPYNISFTDIPNWIKITPEKRIADSKKAVYFTLSINVPKDISPQEQKYNLLFFSEKSSAGNQNLTTTARSSISNAIGNLLILKINPGHNVLGISNDSFLDLLRKILKILP